jgi:chaperonin cofactor prefoldin
MLKWIKSLFGKVEDEIHHVVSDFQNAIDRLEAIVTRKQQVAKDKELEAAKATSAAAAARTDASDAVAIRTGLSNLIARPSQSAS